LTFRIDVGEEGLGWIGVQCFVATMSLYQGAVALYMDWFGGWDVHGLYFGPTLVFVCFLSAYMVVGTVFTIVDVTHWPHWVYSRKVQRESPFVVAGGPKNPSLASTLAQLVVSFAIALVTLLALQWATLRLGRGLHIAPEPSPWFVVVVQMVAWVLLAETGFYFSHRLIHQGVLYQHIHKQHHQFKTPIAISAMYAHPVEVALSNVGAHFVWAFLFGLHPGLVAVAVMAGISLSMFDHCGYWPTRKVTARHHTPVLHILTHP
jgi:sterol desaturase/sphingolipid hydroxylase (fatty acid hydroxylase superfamily)